jgi:tRNA(Ile)-lysidine synthase
MREHMQRLTEDFGPGIVASLVRTADLARSDDTALEQLASDFLVVQELSEGSEQHVDIDSLAKLPQAVRSRVIRRMYSVCAAVERESSPLTYNHVRVIEALITDWHGQGVIALPLGVCAAREQDRLSFYPSS